MFSTQKFNLANHSKQQAYRAIVLSDSPTAYWRLGESSGTTASDENGTYDGTYVGGVTLGVDGVFNGNSGAKFNGTTGRVDIADATALNPLSGGFTVEMWVKLTDTTTKFLMSKGNTSSSTSGYSVYIDGGAGLLVVRCNGGGGSTNRTAQTVTTPVIGTWNHVIMVFNRGDNTFKGYLNGSNAGWSNAFAGSLSGFPDITSTDPLHIAYNTNPFYSADTIDEVAIYPTALSATQIKRHYEVVRNEFDPLVTAYASASGATDLSAINNLIVYVRNEGLINNFRLYPMKSAQNAGSGATVYGVGGLTANDMTLAASPTWGADGIAFNGSTQYGSISDFLASDTLTQFSRFNPTSATPSGRMALFAQFDTSTNNRSLIFEINGSVASDQFDLTRNSTGTASTNEIYQSTDAIYTNSDQCAVAQWTNGGGRNLWQEKTSRSLTLSSGANQTSSFNSSSPIVIGGALSPSAVILFNGVITTSCFVTGTITTQQRETITDLINLL